jgi:polygalacturonase
MDFSSAGYRAGGVKLPSAVASQRLKPAAGDNTARIQAALDTATGAVVLAAGEYEVAGTLCITRSGVVLRGESGAVIRLTGKPHRFLEIHGTGTWQEEGPSAPVLDAYVPAGANTFRVRGASAFHPAIA